MGKYHASAPLWCWKSAAGRVLRIVNVVHVLQGAAESQPVCNLAGDLWGHLWFACADKLQTKKMRGGGEAQCLIKIRKNGKIN